VPYAREVKEAMDDHQVVSKAMKVCPRCFEQVHADAEICRYCHSRISNAKDGQYVRVRAKAGDKIYRGDLFVGKTERISDTINDTRRFIILSNAKEEGKLSDISIGFLALNKDSIESVRLSESDDGKGSDHVRQIY
jgi:ribosomal protein L40E